MGKKKEREKGCYQEHLQQTMQNIKKKKKFNFTLLNFKITCISQVKDR